jgi:glycosyltransferase involved in cell wall biosynthesis
MDAKSRTSICIIVENLPVPLDPRVWKEACALRDAGYEVSVICPKGPGHESSRETLEGIDIHRHWAYRASSSAGYIFEYAAALFAEFYLSLIVYARTRFRILQACNPPDTTFLIALFFKLLGVRFVFDHHDLSPELYSSRYLDSGLLFRLVCLAERLSFRFADMSLATNDSYRDVAISRGGMKSERVFVVQTCTDLSEVEGATMNPDLKNGRPHLVVYVGIMEPQDGVHLLLESIRYLVQNKHREDTFFAIIGWGTELARLKVLASEWGLDSFVTFTGRLPHEEVGPWISTADVCVAPDPSNPLNDKSTMIKILEYMAYARPIVMFDLPEGRRSAEGAALFARPNDPVDFAAQLETLLENESLREQLGRTGRKRMEDGLNWDAQRKKLIDAFETVANGLPARHSPVSSRTWYRF